MFWFKKFFGRFFYPLPVLFAILIAGGLLWKYSRKRGRRKAGRRLVILGVVAFVLLTTGPWTAWLLSPLEHWHSRFVPDEQPADWNPDAVVVLAGDYTWAPDIPLHQRVGTLSRARLAEGMRLASRYPDSILICAGGPQSPDEPAMSAEMVALAVEWGFPKERTLAEIESRDTKDHVKFLQARLTGKEFILVTSASHMPRSMALFRSGGLTPTAAPTGHRTNDGLWGNVPSGLSGFFPNSGRIRHAEVAIYEYLGLTWAWLRGQLHSG